MKAGIKIRTLLATGLLLALLIAGVASFYASTQPDGLNFVADKTGFSSEAKDSPTSGGPLAGYEAKGVENARASRGVAGVVGTLAVAGLAGGLFWGIRRRSSVDESAEQDVVSVD